MEKNLKKIIYLIRELDLYLFCITGSLCYKTETNTTLQINYTSIFLKKEVELGMIGLTWGITEMYKSKPTLGLQLGQLDTKKAVSH